MKKEYILEPKEAFNMFRVPSNLEDLVNVLISGIMSDTKKKQDHFIKLAEVLSEDLNQYEIKYAQFKTVQILNHIRVKNGLEPMDIMETLKDAWV